MVLKEGYPIIRVIHERDGDWQFLGDGRNFQEEDAMVVSLKEIVEYDKTVSDIINMPEGKQAIRDSVGGIWHITDLEF